MESGSWLNHWLNQEATRTDDAAAFGNISCAALLNDDALPRQPARSESVPVGTDR